MKSGFLYYISLGKNLTIGKLAESIKEQENSGWVLTGKCVITEHSIDFEIKEKAAIV